jgi:hypothetical protein
MRARDRYREDQMNTRYLGQPTGRTQVKAQVFQSVPMNTNLNQEILRDIKRHTQEVDHTKIFEMVVLPTPHKRLVPTVDTAGDGVPTRLPGSRVRVLPPINNLRNPYLWDKRMMHREEAVYYPRSQNDRLCVPGNSSERSTKLPMPVRSSLVALPDMRRDYQ